jgi:hypothetical protein
MNHKALFSAELRDCDLINRIEEEPAVTREELSDAQGEWEAEQYEEELSDFDPHRDFYAEMDDEPVMDLPNDLFMIFDDPDYWD